MRKPLQGRPKKECAKKARKALVVLVDDFE